MMEFLISKFWAFLVAVVVMGVLVQGIQMDARSDRSEALNGLAEELETMFRDLANAGPGLVTTIDLGQMLPSEARLTLFVGHGLLEEGGREVLFVLPQITLVVESAQDGVQEVDSMVLGPNDSLSLVNQADGTTLTMLNR